MRSPYRFGLGLLLAACTAQPHVPRADRAAERGTLPAAHPLPSEATRSNAGAAVCRQRATAVAANAGDFALGFGERGGLVVWSGARGLEAAPFDPNGNPVRTQRVIPLALRPQHVAPLGPGFLVVGAQADTPAPACNPRRCIDPTCAGFTSNQPQVCMTECSPCPGPTRGGLALLATDDDGVLLAAPVPLPGSTKLLATFDGDGRALGLLTDEALFWIEQLPDASLAVRRVAFGRKEYVLAVRGGGPPAFLAVDGLGAVELFDAEASRPIEGALVASGMFVDARLQARWAEGKIHVARQAWTVAPDAIQTQTIEGGALRSTGETVKTFPSPFADYLSLHSVNAGLQRESWLQQKVGGPIDPTTVVPGARLANARSAFTGSVFAIATHDSESALWLVAADCREPSRMTPTTTE